MWWGIQIIANSRRVDFTIIAIENRGRFDLFDSVQTTEIWLSIWEKIRNDKEHHFERKGGVIYKWRSGTVSAGCAGGTVTVREAREAKPATNTGEDRN